MKSVSKIMNSYLSSTDNFRQLSESTPVVPRKNTWEVVKSPERLMKTFVFENRLMLIDFVREILVYENRINHHGQIRISSLEVSVEVYTHDLNRITDRDREYASTVDLIRQDIDHYGYEENQI